MKFVKYPSIEQFRTALSEINYHGLGNMDLKFYGTVKIHGTNAAVSWDYNSDLLTCQSRSLILSRDSDNAGFCQFIESDVATSAIKTLMTALKTPDMDNIILFGEWCGKGIQKGVAVCELSRRFIIFSAAYLKNDELIWFDLPSTSPSSNTHERELNDTNIFLINQFKTWEMNINTDVDKLPEITDKLCQLTQLVEDECPVGKYFNVSGIGEGIVWTGNFISSSTNKVTRFAFKVKGAKHSMTKVKTLVPIKAPDVNLTEFISYAVTESRLEQGFNELFANVTHPIEKKDVRPFIEWVINDVIKEESDTIAKNNINIGQLKKNIASFSKEWFLNHLISTGVSSVVF